MKWSPLESNFVFIQFSPLVHLISVHKFCNLFQPILACHFLVGERLFFDELVNIHSTDLKKTLSSVEIYCHLKPNSLLL